MNKIRTITVKELECFGATDIIAKIRYHPSNQALSLYMLESDGGYSSMLEEQVEDDHIDEIWILESSYFITAHPLPIRLI